MGRKEREAGTMSKTKQTELIEKALCREFHRQYGCLEVSIGIGSRIKERVDYMVFDHYKNAIKCFEIKVTKADFRSSAAKSFVGHYNYYAMPYELYCEVAEEIPSEIGVYTFSPNTMSNGGFLTCEKKAKRKELTDAEILNLKDSLIRSLSRDANKLYQSEDETLLQRYKRELSRAKRANGNLRDNLYRCQNKCFWLEHKMIEEHGREYVKEFLKDKDY